MYFLLSLIVTGILGYFLPQWMYDLSWQDLINALQGKTSELEKFIKDIGIIDKTALEFAVEKFTILVFIILAIFIGMLILTTIIKKAIKK